MDMRIPPLKIKILLESNPLKSRILVQRLAVRLTWHITVPSMFSICEVLLPPQPAPGRAACGLEQQRSHPSTAVPSTAMKEKDNSTFDNRKEQYLSKVLS